MKQRICALILVCLLLSLSGCGYSVGGFKEPVCFYYPRYESDYLYGEENSVIVSEEREAAGHTGHIEYLLTMYLAGSLDESLASPFPAGTKLIKVVREEDTLIVELNANPSLMTDHEFSLGCTCMTLTCLELTDASAVKVVSGDKSATMSWEDLTLYDDIFTEPEE